MHLLRTSCLLLLGLHVFLSVCTGQDETTSRPPGVYYPSRLPYGEWRGSIGLSLSTLPQEIVEEEMNQSPAADFQSRLGMPWGFSIEGRALVQVLQNHVSLGARWSHSLGRFAFGIGDDIAWWFGFLAVEGFDDKADGWLNYPYITIGYDFGSFQLAGRAEAVLVMSYRSFAGENKISTEKNSFSGFSFSLAIEQPFWKNTHLALGLKLSYLRFYYQSWFVFETFKRYLFIPEISVGFIL
jgi:hypothetical protein